MAGSSTRFPALSLSCIASSQGGRVEGGREGRRGGFLPRLPVGRDDRPSVGGIFGGRGPPSRGEDIGLSREGVPGSRVFVVLSTLPRRPGRSLRPGRLGPDPDSRRVSRGRGG